MPRGRERRPRGARYRQNFLSHASARSAARRADDACHIVICLSDFARVSAAGCALAEHQCQQSAEHDATEKQRPIGGLQGKKPSFAHNVRKHRKTRCWIIYGLTILGGHRNGCSATSTEGCNRTSHDVWLHYCGKSATTIADAGRGKCIPGYGGGGATC